MLRNKYNNNIWDFTKHVNAHRKRVYLLGITLDDSLLTRYVLILHDIEKYLFLPWLWKYYAGKGNKKAAKKLYTRMNRIGRWIFKTCTFMCNKDSLLRSQIIEKIADVVDRQCDPVAVEEFEKIRPMSEFLKETYLVHAEKLQSQYIEIVKDYHGRIRKKSKKIQDD